MNKNLKISAVAGVILYALAAFFALCLLTVVFDFAGDNPAKGLFLYNIGKMFTGVYGFCSALIPLFLLVAALQCFTAKWHVRNGVLLLGSIIPFFTLDAVEHVCHMMAENNEGDALIMKVGAALLTGLIIVAVEYLVLSMIGDAVEGKEIRGELGEKTSEKKEEVINEEAVQPAAEKPAEQIEYEKAVEKDAENIRQKKNDLMALKEKLAARRQEIKERLESSEKVEEKVAVENEAAAEDEKAPEEPVSPAADAVETDIVTEDNPFAHVFDEQEKEEAAPAEENVVEQADESPAEEAAPAEENDEDPFADLSDEIPEDSEIKFDESVYDEETADASEEPEEADSNPFDDFDFPTEVQETQADNGTETSSLNDDYETPSEVPVQEEPVDVAEPEEPVESGVVEKETEDVFEEPADSGVVVEEPEDVSGEPVSADAEDDIEEAEAADGNDGFGDNSFSSEFENEPEGDNDLSEFVEERNNSFESIFAQMDRDAAKNPAGPKDDAFGEDISSVFDESAVEKGIPTELDKDYTVKDDYEFDPMANPIVDSNGMPFGTAVPFDIGENSYEEVAKAKKTSKPLSFAEKAVFLQDSGEEKPESEPELPPVSKKTAVDSEGKPVVDLEKIEKRKPKLKLSNYKIPVDGILTKYDNGEYWIVDEDTKKKAADLKQTLNEFNIEVEVTGIRKGPVVTMFEVLPAPGVNVNKIRSLQDNIALRLAATSVRIVSPIPGKSAVGIEIPNKSRAVVSFREIMEQKNPAFEKMNIPVILGKDISGEPQVIDLAKTPHLLIAGSTGSGKSVCVNSLILSILYKRNPQQVKLILIDPKVVELKLYNDIPHLLTPVITEPKKALQSLQYCLCEMERRYALLDNMGVRDINSYNRRIEERKLMQEKLPYIVVIIDEFADLMATTGKELESNVARLAAMSRAVGIHLVLATQRPSVNVITGLIKANIPSRIAFMVASRTDSNIIIDQIGAEKLLGKGDMLYASATDPFPVRIQGTLVSDDEVEKVVEYVKQYGEPDYIDDEIFVEDEDEESSGPGLFSDGEDALYDQALEIVIQSGKASASYLQRRLKIGYNRAARLVEEMEERGIVGPQNGSKPREVIHVPD